MSESTIFVSHLLLYFTSIAPQSCTLPRRTFNWYQSRWEASTAPQGRRGHVLRLRSNLVSAESGVRSADKPVGLAAVRNWIWAHFGPRLASASDLQPVSGHSRFAAGSAISADLGHLTNKLQVQVFKQVNTGWRLSITGYRWRFADSAHCRFCCNLLSYAFLMYKILWVWFSDIPPLRLLHLQSLWLMYDLMRLNVSAVICA